VLRGGSVVLIVFVALSFPWPLMLAMCASLAVVFGKNPFLLFSARRGNKPRLP